MYRRDEVWCGGGVKGGVGVGYHVTILYICYGHERSNYLQN